MFVCSHGGAGCRSLCQYKVVLYTISNVIEVYEKPAPWTKKILHRAVEFEVSVSRIPLYPKICIGMSLLSELPGLMFLLGLSLFLVPGSIWGALSGELSLSRGFLSLRVSV